jgi:D-serine deaminase-like pyridoxal phosphate-dependent protein
VRLADLNTPCALVDLDVLERNCSRMSARAERLRVKLRPHVKTHKCVDIARIQTRGQSGAITVSTLAEARAFADAGFLDITYAVPVPFPAIPEASALVRQGVHLKLLLDHEATLQELEAFGSAQGVSFPVFLKVDCGYHRAGVDPTREESAAFASRVARSPHLRLEGLLTHAGHAYRSRSPHEVRQVAEQERAVVAGFAAKLRLAGVPVPEVSAGSTPTCCMAEDWTGVTEIRPGNYAFFDAFQVAMGSCSLADAVAFTVLATVIGHYPERGTLLLNAGALALSKDPGPVHMDPDCGFGIPCDAQGQPICGMRLTSPSQEHSEVEVTDPGLFARFPVGSLLRIIPNHSCLAAGCFERYVVLRSGEVVDEWRAERGW